MHGNTKKLLIYIPLNQNPFSVELPSLMPKYSLKLYLVYCSTGNIDMLSTEDFESKVLALVRLTY